MLFNTLPRVAREQLISLPHRVNYKKTFNKRCFRLHCILQFECLVLTALHIVGQLSFNHVLGT